MRKGIVIYAIAAVTLLFVWGAVSFVTNSRHEEATLFFGERLRAIGGEEVVVLKGISYRVQSGTIGTSSILSNDMRYRILSLAYLKELTERSPHLSLAGTDPGKLRDAVTELGGMAAELSASQEIPSNDIAALYPLSFLAALAETEQARLTFLASGKDADANDYAAKLARATASYMRHIVDFKAAFERAVPISARPYATERNIISREGALEALDSLSAAMMKMQLLIKKRERCVRGETALCNAEDEMFAQLQPVQSSAPHSSDTLALAVHIRDTLRELGIDIPAVDNPLVSLSESACIRGDAGAGPLFVMSELGVMNVGDIRFLSTDTYKQVPFYKYFYDRGILYIPVFHFSHYKCQEMAGDVGRVLAVRAVRAFARETPQSARAPTSEAAALRLLEDKLSSPEVIYESDATAYIAAAQRSSASKTPPLAAAVASLSLEMRGHSAGLDEVVRNISRIERENLSLSRDGIEVDLAPPYLFFVRSAFPSLLLADNVSATGQLTQLFPRNDIPPAEQPFVSFSSLVGDAAAFAEIKKGMAFFYNLHNP